MEEQELPKSTLEPVAEWMGERGERLEPVPVDEWEHDPTGGYHYKKEVIQRAFVPHIKELANKVGTPGTIGPSRGVSFRAEDGKYYDLIELLRDLSSYVDNQLRIMTFNDIQYQDNSDESKELNKNIGKQNKWIKTLAVITTISIVISLLTLLVTVF